tara:strand:+ start:1192 stop:1404 length:213 start_codon:yes stop_codon:yes gene_type:complete
MIKKNTKIIFEGQEGKELMGGIPLSVGETINLYPEASDESVKYEVVDKKVDFYMKGDDQTADIVYTLKKV